ncbi:hypothetical protein [Rummeliibacillus stabekisii]|uniref:Uncharacterized protein n=1 Tax=Rummeliibacillus stabekisii TaxID=241244 RepID=A0A143HD29_9BACL|nr:hypothetical protein [Rummeliibacillus stabekisii]AMW99380.1 hypothetical protein ATY39_07815 [Rummeliibacillus stabekisii]
MGMGTGVAMFNLFIFILPIIFYLVPVVFIIWFLVKLLKAQQEMNELLRTIVYKMDKKSD